MPCNGTKYYIPYGDEEPKLQEIHNISMMEEIEETAEIEETEMITVLLKYPMLLEIVFEMPLKDGIYLIPLIILNQCHIKLKY